MKMPYMMNSLGWQTVVATPPITTHGLSTVWPPVTDVPASSAASLKPWMTSGMTLSLSCKGHHTGQGKKLKLTQVNLRTNWYPNLKMYFLFNQELEGQRYPLLN